MDFFAHQQQARRSSSRLVVFFGLGVLATIVLAYLIITLALGFEQLAPWHQPEVFIAVAGAIAGLMLLSSFFKMASLSSGGAAVAEALGGKRVLPTSRDGAERRLYHIVEEMALASGIQVPQVFVLEEDGINAFAAGWSPADAAVAATRGAINRLTREELQGVMAHEFSHIFHGDMRLNLRLMGWLAGLAVLTVAGRMLLYSSHVRPRSRSDKGGNPLPLIGMGLLVLGGISMLFARLIQAAVSRQREFLADASAVQYTRNPQGIAGALSKIGGINSGSRILHPGSTETSHMFFANGLAPSALASFFATHPPLEERIQRLDPTLLQGSNSRPSVAGGSRPSRASSFSGEQREPRELLDAIGNIGPGGIEQSQSLLKQIPVELVSASHEPAEAGLLLLALTLDTSRDILPIQLDILLRAGGQGFVSRVEKFAQRISTVRIWRIEIVSLCLPALQSLSPQQKNDFLHLLTQLISADERIDLFEFATLKLLERAFSTSRQKFSRRIEDPAKLLSPFGTVLAAMARCAGDDRRALQAFESGWKIFSATTPTPDWKLFDTSRAGLDKALTLLHDSDSADLIVPALSQAVYSDGQLQEEEYLLLRAVASVLDCPLPPIRKTTA